jgi:hypothetical protein
MTLVAIPHVRAVQIKPYSLSCEDREA